MLMVGLHAKFEGIRTPNTHCVTFGSILGFFSRENLSKCIKSQNSMKFIMDALHGDVSVSKKIGFILLV